MTTDERIEALTQSVELLSQMHQDNEKRFTHYLDLLTQNMQVLTKIVRSHETRITDLEA